MEHQILRRRVNMILGHVAGTPGSDEALPNHVFPMNCSSSLNSVIGRCDNRMLFARQGSNSQACFMRQVSVKQNFEQGSSIEQDVPLSSAAFQNKDVAYEKSGTPLYSRPAQTEYNLSNFRDHQPVKQESESSAAEPPKFARTNKGLSGQNKSFSKKIRHTSGCNGMEWSPRMDVAESGCNYVVTVELPGVSINSIRVEVDDRNLIVAGNRSTQWWRVVNSSEDSSMTYHRREILQGPYQIVWSLPDDANRDGVSAEFVDGFLQITLPKL